MVWGELVQDSVPPQGQPLFGSMTQEQRNYIQNTWNDSVEGRDWVRKVKEREEWKLRMCEQAKYEYGAVEDMYEEGEDMYEEGEDVEHEEGMTGNLAFTPKPQEENDEMDLD